jgi:prepilin-type N-terminal cleavage/methylation domain-containing protein
MKRQNDLKAMADAGVKMAGEDSMRRSAGFSLLELLVVVVIVAVVAAFAVPRLILSRLDRNQETAVRTLQEIAAKGAELTASGGRFADLRGMVKAGHLDPRYLSPRGVDGYRYVEGPVAGTGGDGGPAMPGVLAEPLAGHGRFIYAIASDRIVRYQSAAAGFSLPEGVTPGAAVPGVRAP